MLSSLGSYIKRLLGPREIEIVEDHPTRVVLRTGPTLTIFDTASEQVTQNGKLVAMVPLITEISVYQQESQASTTVWYVSTKVAGGRTVELGHSYSKEDATHVAGVLSVLLKKPVKAHK